MKTLRLSQIVLLTGLLCAVASGSEEDIHPPHRISIWAQAGNGFGEVSATLEVTKATRIFKSISLTVHGKKFAVPQADLKKLLQPRLDTAQIRTGGSRDGGPPWLYVTFLVASPNAGYSTAYIKFRDGRLRGIGIWPDEAEG